MRRKPNPDQRRRELCDTAIRLLADDGVKGVSHLKVDRKAGVPDGTTSFYFRTRSALLQAVAVRVSELDLKDLSAAANEPSGLAALVMRSATGTRLVRTKARQELALQAIRDPLLDEALRSYRDRFLALITDAVLRLHPAGHTPDRSLADRQAYVVMMFIGGVLQGFAAGERRIGSTAELEALISGIIVGLASSAALRS
ncbi:TetR/AcrR family transcriptional regulator [Mycolicibacter senuensis]|uniref:TetR/AcrR family transcriptional regulator n=1 Tax=Mycolicibacter senuensis TaxID=386913 RepID=UPI000DCBA6DD|nr:TetR family transcriptional regulator [Mycolicibacter senuensis]RAV02235.1 TetR/AcrR family transcriptional regulator [Mycolicibacter senuensis]